MVFPLFTLKAVARISSMLLHYMEEINYFVALGKDQSSRYKNYDCANGSKDEFFEDINTGKIPKCVCFCINDNACEEVKAQLEKNHNCHVEAISSLKLKVKNRRIFKDFREGVTRIICVTQGETKQK